MSRVFLRSALYCKSCTNSVVTNHLSNRGLFSVFQSVNKCTKRDELGQTMILLEDGGNIRELPIIVRKVSNNSIIFSENKISNGGNTLVKVDQDSKVENKLNDRGKSNSNDLEAQEIIDYFNKCYTARGIFAILETIPANEVTPNVALQALKKIVTLENNKTFRNTVGEAYRNIENEANQIGLHENETFTRTAVLSRLVDKILTSGDSDILLNGYLIVNRDIIGKYIDQDNKNRFTNEILCRVTDGKFSINHTCEAIKIFSDIAVKFNENVDKLWVGITEKSNDITKNNIMNVVRCLPYLYKSRKVVLSVVEKKLFDFWYTIDGHNVAEILVILTQIKSHSPRILSILSQWVNKNIHTATEDDLIEIINGFCLVNYNNSAIEQALERYVKAKGVSIKNPALMGSIMDYCSKFHVRSPVLLQGAAEYVVVHGNSLSPVLLQRLFLPLGKLFYQPTNGYNFWRVLEATLEEKFIQFRPEEAIDMLLHCVYLQKYPLNFVKKVFNPYFLDRLHSYKNKEIIILSRSKLQILDVAMTLECSQYQGPILPKPLNSPPIWQDGRVKRMTNNIRSILSDIAGSPECMAYNMIPARLPSSDIYVIDALMLNKSVSIKMWPINLERDYNLHTAIIIHTPEHYCSHGRHLLGKQEMRKRHFRYLGLKVVSLDLNELAKLRVHPRALRNYIEEMFSRAELPFPRTVSLAKP
ncbi:hypothetical protein J6590_013987 [Homalodisca vitripennis]|nr:hypothetical protein J6590_013987 [Homalodisca vitripennis]